MTNDSYPAPTTLDDHLLRRAAAGVSAVDGAVAGYAAKMAGRQPWETAAAIDIFVAFAGTAVRQAA